MYILYVKSTLVIRATTRDTPELNVVHDHQVPVKIMSLKIWSY